MAWLRATLETARQSVLRLLVRRTVLILVSLFAVLALFVAAVLIGRAPRRLDGDELFVVLGYWLYLQVLLPCAAMFFGVQAVHGDIEDRTYQYLFLRPVPRSALLVGKWLAVSAVSAALMTLGVGLLLLALQLPWIEWRAGGPPRPSLLGPFAWTIAVAAPAYAAVAALLAARFRRPMIWAAAYILGLEGLAANLPPEVGVRVLTVADPMRRNLLGLLDLRAEVVRRVQGAWHGRGSLGTDDLGNPQGTLVFLTLICLAVAVWIYSRSEYDSRPRE